MGGCGWVEVYFGLIGVGGHLLLLGEVRWWWMEVYFEWVGWGYILGG